MTCNGRAVPLHPTGRNGEFVAGVRYRAWQPPSALHPTIPVHAPLTFDIVDTWNDRSLGGCQYHVAHPGGRSYDRFPVNSYEAESRRLVAVLHDRSHARAARRAAPSSAAASFPTRWICAPVAMTRSPSVRMSDAPARAATRSRRDTPTRSADATGEPAACVACSSPRMRAALTATRLARAQAGIERQLRENGVTYNVYAESHGGHGGPGRVDALPLIIPADEWERSRAACGSGRGC